VLAERLGDDVSRRRQDLVERRVVGDRDLGVQVRAPVGVDQGGLGIEGVLEVDDRREGFDVDDDGLGGVLGEVARLGHHHGDRFAHEAHVAVGQQAVGPVEVAQLLVGGGIEHQVVEVGGEQHSDDAGHGLGLRRVDLDDRAAGDVAADERHMQGAGDHDVVDVGAPTGEETGVLLARDAGSHEAPGVGAGGLGDSACRRGGVVGNRAHLHLPFWVRPTVGPSASRVSREGRAPACDPSAAPTLVGPGSRSGRGPAGVRRRRGRPVLRSG
jgi:hypothetical protein